MIIAKNRLTKTRNCELENFSLAYVRVIIRSCNKPHRRYEICRPKNEKINLKKRCRVKSDDDDDDDDDITSLVLLSGIVVECVSEIK